MLNNLPVLYYVHDPMCSWCWGFRPVWQQVEKALAGKVIVHYVLGGLAPDTQQPMPESMQLTIKNTWQRIQQEIPGAEFNYEFWKKCKPRRSTYPSCRAVLAAGMQGEKYAKTMLLAIQQAYYLQAKNPSDETTLIQLASDIGLDEKQFETDLLSDNCEELLQNERQSAIALGVDSYPSLVLSYKESNTLIYINYTNSDTIVSNILKLV